MNQITRTLTLFAALFVAALHAPLVQSQTPARDVEVIAIVGAEGAEEYSRRFTEQLTAWRTACAKAGVSFVSLGDSSDKTKGDDIKKLEMLLKAAVAKPEGQLWLVWIGHGTFDGREAKFNLRGPDASPQQIEEWLKPLKRELVMVQAASASAPFLSTLAGPRRIIVTATKGADEVFYARFGEYFAPAIGGLPEADLDQDQQISVLEAFLHASKKTAEFYQQEERLATEHALIEDNGDGVGTRAEIFTGVTATPPAGAKADGARAAQVALVLSPDEAALPETVRAQRDELERQLEQLKAERAKLGDDRYYAQLETILRRLSLLYAAPPTS